MLLKTKQILSVLFIIVVFSAISCDDKSAISVNYNFQSGIWNINEEIIFDVEISDINKSFNLYVEAEIFDDFLTNNLWLFVSSQSPSKNIQNDTLMFYVADDKGKWFGTKSGDIIKNKFLYKSNIKFVESGVYNFSLSHGMREKDLPKISSVSIVVEEVKLQ